MSKILTLAATGFAGLVLGAGVGVAAAGQDSTPPAAERAADVSSMEEMHALMVDQMPAELAEQCDQMHTTMGHVDHGSMMGGMGSMTGGMGDLPAQHDLHHPGTEE